MDPTQSKAMQNVVNRLHEKLPNVAMTHLQHEVGDAFDQYQHSRVRDFVPILVEREVLDRTTEAGVRA
jgi:hypothetical protein